MMAKLLKLKNSLNEHAPLSGYIEYLYMDTAFSNQSYKTQYHNMSCIIAK